MSEVSSAFSIRSRRIITEAGSVDGVVVVRSGKIESVLPGEEAGDAPNPIDVGDSVVMPGLVDTHVHINEPGRTEWEGFETATRAAAAGGVTTLVDMPLNSIPATTNVAALEEKIRAAAGKLYVDCGFHGGVVPSNADDLLALADAGVFGFKAFMIDSGVPEFAAVGERDLRRSMSVIANTGLPLLVHAEIGAFPVQSPGPPNRYSSWLASRPKRWENRAISLVVRLSDELGCPVHIVHLSSADALVVLKRARARGSQVTVETCPHYLYFASEEIPDGATLLKCAPPIREKENRERLWAALETGLIDLVVTDHSPAPPKLKALEAGNFIKAWGGIASLQAGLAATWTAARARGISIEDVSRWMAAAPSRLVGLFGRKGVIRPGADADLVVFDADAPFVVDSSRLLDRHKLSPYAGCSLFGVVEKTFLRGELVCDGGVMSGSPRGELLRRTEL